MTNFRAAMLASAALLSFATPGFAAPAAIGTWGVDLSARDTAVKPGDDFWAYANRSWDARTQIAADQTSAGGFLDLANGAEASVRTIVDGLARSPHAPGSAGQQIADSYASWMDAAAIEAKGTAPLKPWLARIDAVKDRAGLLKLFATTEYFAPVRIGISPNPADPTVYAATVSQGGLGMPNRDYYLKDGAKYDAFRAAYRNYVIQMLTLAGFSEPAARAERIIAVETRIAKDQWTPERSRDVTQIINPMTRAQLTALAPQFDWTTTLTNAGLGNVETVIVGQTTAIAAAGKLLDAVPLSTWKDYLAFHFIRSHAQYLPRAFDEADFAFFSKTLRDQPAQKVRWKRGVALLNTSLGEAVGRLYVERNYPPESDRQMGELIANLRASLGERIAANAWMDAATKREAQAKLTAFDPRIGHPVKYIDYAPLKIVSGDVIGNAVRAEQFRWALQLSRLGKPVDRGLWGMTPQTVNAYYNALQNQITFPAAILQPPFFDPKADPAVNYGAIGAVIGHEIGHGFDDQGRRFAADGRLRDWWSPESAKLFTERTTRFGAQYDSYEPVPGVHINGALTMGENIGDLGGIEMAYGAWRRYVAQHGEPPVIDGYTGDQRFFLAFAQAWREKRREGAVREQLLGDPHSPAIYRVNGIVRNVDAWYKAFDVKPGDALYLPPEQRVHIW
ncbi:MAG: M13 family metallopeptidase [Sphingomonadaceae bacterium]|nr:M13 family metallopeptidase [Sphingomonadaceae bacterium]